MPKVEKVMTDRLTTWQALQEREVVAYRAAYARQGDYRGFFSIPEYTDAVRAGQRIAEACPRCLDVGCGVLARPSYMLPTVEFVGIDPFEGEGPRNFEFHQGVGEHLPFPDDSFPCVSFMSTLDHQVEPLAALREAWRVLWARGRLYVWLNLRDESDARYQWWKTQPPGTLFDDHHQHAFTQADVEGLLEQAGFNYVGRECYPGTSYWPPSQLLLGIKGI